jgi:vesicle coat complex subunit
VPRANIKVSSTETGAIFGNIVYESTGYNDRSVVVLNDIHIDIMDYISPAYCADVQFRSMWAEFEWENKVHCCSPLAPRLDSCFAWSYVAASDPCFVWKIVAGLA